MSTSINNNENKTGRVWLRYLCAVLIPAIILLASYMAAGIAPFGDKTLSYSDAYGQYNTFYNFYRNLLTGSADWFYSFEMILGDGISGLFAYYIASPFNLVYLLFSQADTQIATDLVILLKVSFCGLTSAIWFRHRSAAGLRWKTLLFTTAYALCGYNMAFCFNTMWLDSVLMLPLIALGIQNIVKGKSPLLYVLSLGLAILFNFYTGYMLCIFSVCWFALVIFRSEVSGRELAGTTARYALASLLAGGISAILLLPTVKAMTGGLTASHDYLKNYIYGTVTYLLKLLGWDESRYKFALLGLGCFVLLEIALVFFALLTTRKKPRFSAGLATASVVLLAVYYLLVEGMVQAHYLGTIESTALVAKNFIFGEVTGAEAMGSGPFVYVGLLNLLLAISFFFNRSVSRKSKIGHGVLLGVLCLSFLFYLPNFVWHAFQITHCFSFRYSFMISFVLLCMAEESFDTLADISLRPLAISAAVLVGIACLVTAAGYETGLRLAEMVCLIVFFMLAIGFNGKGKVSSALLAGAVLVQIAFLGWSAGATLNDISAGAMTLSDYQARNERGTAVMDTLNGLDSSFTRVREEKPVMNHNDAMQFGFNGAYHYSSTINYTTIEFLASIGIHTRPEFWAQHGTATRAADTLLGFEYDTMCKQMLDYAPVADNILQNPYVLPLAFETGSDALSEEIPAGENAFENLNTIYRALMGWDENLFRPADAEASIDGQTARIELTVENNDALYVLIPSTQPESINVLLNGEDYSSSSYIFADENLPLGIFSAGDRVTVEITFADGTQPELPEKSCYYESTELLAEASEALQGIVKAVEVPTDSHVTATVETENATELLFSIPYDAGWSAKVDGSTVTVQKAFGALIAVDIPEGSHTVELSYVPDGFIPGALISSVSLLTLAGWLMVRRQKAKKAAALSAPAVSTPENS